MRPEDIKIGLTYETRVDGRYVPVIVVSEVPTEEHLNRRFVVRRIGSQRSLSKPRTAAALHQTRPVGELAECEVKVST